MKKIKSILNNPLFILFLSGLFLIISFLFTNILAEILAFFVIAPAFYALTKLEYKKRYLGGLLFFGAWMLPTSYWYFNFMPIWLAVLALSFFTLIAHVFHISNLIKKKSIFLDFAIIIVSWLFLTFLRINLPIIKDWWIPDIAYTQWQNIFVLQIANFLGIYGIIFLILITNATLAFLWIKKKKIVSIIFIIFVSFIFLFGNFVINNFAKTKGQSITFIAIQASPENGYQASTNINDIQKLKKITQSALEKIQNKSLKNIFVLWPENMIAENNTADLINFSKENNIFLVYSRGEKQMAIR